MAGIPTLSGTINAALSAFLFYAQKVLASKGIDLDLEYVSYKFPHWYARNLVCRKFLMSDADQLWFFDDDVLPTPQVLRLVEHDADIVSGAYQAARRSKDGMLYEPMVLLYKLQDGTDGSGGFLFASPKDPSDMVMPIDGAGGGCLLIKRRVLEDRRMWYATTYSDLGGNEHDYMEENLPENDKWAPPIFMHHSKPGGDDILSEDLDFFRRAGALGYTMIGDFSAKLGHLKTCDVSIIANSISTAALHMAHMLGAEKIAHDESQEAPDASAA